MKSADRGQGLLWGLAVVGLLGAGTVLSGALGPDAVQTWRTYLVNFVFWTGLAAGAVLLSAVLTLTGARWAGPIQRLSEAFADFLPLSCLLFAALWPGRAVFYPWLASAPHARQVWLDPAFLYGRDGIALVLLAAAAQFLSRASRLQDRGRSAAWATLYAILYGVVLSLLGFDWIMSLDAHWVSTLFGAYYFVGSFYAGLAALAVLTGWSARGLGIQQRQTQDLGTLLLGFAFTVGYLFFVQFLVLWYGNVPAETRYLLVRLREAPWAGLSRVVLVVAFCLPVLVLLFRRAKARPAALAAAGGVALAGMWLERFVLVAPSLSQSLRVPLGLKDLLITTGFGALLALSVLLSLRRFPPKAEAES